MPLGAKRIAAVPKTRREAIMGRGLLLLMALSLLSTGATGVEGSDGRADPDRPKPRARELGLEFGVLPTGPHNAITDVSGVRVGHFTLQRIK